MKTTVYECTRKWIIDEILKQHKQRPRFIGINGSQGIGKSTLASTLVTSLTEHSIKAVSISIDDFYLTHSEQVELAKRFSDNPYLQSRGYPGTHDIQLGTEVLTQLKTSKQHTVKIPRYNKSAFQGKGDRFPESLWTTIQTPIDIVFLDGWMFGYTSVDKSFLPNRHFDVTNEFLKDYEKNWYPLVDDFIFLEPEKIEYVLEWRTEAEEKMKASGKDGMSREEIHRYLMTFIPAYETYLPYILKQNPFHGKTLHFVIGKSRQPSNLVHF